MKLELEDFRHGKYKYEPKPGELRLVKDNNMWGYVDDEGNVVIPGQFLSLMSSIREIMP